MLRRLEFLDDFERRVSSACLPCVICARHLNSARGEMKAMEVMVVVLLLGIASTTYQDR